jgi:hypothetical protein
MSLSNHDTEPDAAWAGDAGPQAARMGDGFPRALVPAVMALWRQSGEQHWIYTQGESMLPLIREGDRLLLSYNLTTVRAGSIIVFSPNGRLIAHRVLRILPGSPPHFITRGDNSCRFDVRISADEVLGHVLAVQKQNRLLGRESVGVIALERPKWRAIGWLVVAVTLVVAVPYGWLRGVKQRFWGQRSVPGIRFVRRGSRKLLTTVLTPFVRFDHTQR